MACLPGLKIKKQGWQMAAYALYTTRKMTHEKVFILETGRKIKLIVKGTLDRDLSKVAVEMNVSIKDYLDNDFRLPIDARHPKYWKLQKLDLLQARMLLLKCSGLSKQQIRQTLSEFENIYHRRDQLEYV